MLNFDENVQAVSTSKPMLKPFNIYEVECDGVNLKEMQGVKDPTQNYVIMEVNFSNEQGTFTHSIFMPKAGDEIRKTSTQGFEMPSMFETFKIFIKQLATVLVGEDKYNTFFDKIKSSKLDFSNPDHFKKFIDAYSKLLAPAKGKKTSIKLMGKLDAKSGRTLASLPFFAKINREGELYPTNFVGDNLFFTSPEKSKVDAYTEEAPTKMGAVQEDLLPGINNDLTNMSMDNEAFEGLEIDEI